MIEDSWENCYGSGWQNILVPEAFSHPAKVSFKLSERIYKHVLEEGWAKPGSTVIDPFLGIGGFAFHALLNGLHFTGCELEPKFHKLALENIALWNKRYSQMPKWGSAVCLCGDSRNLRERVGGADCCLSSPPYADAQAHPSLGSVNNDDWGNDGRDIAAPRGKSADYGNTPGQLGQLPATDAGFQAALAVSSPPYARGLANAANYADSEKREADSQRDIIKSNLRHEGVYGQSPAQLGNMKAGDFDVVVSSPPFLANSGGTNVTAKTGPLSDGRLLKRQAAGNATAGYGNSEGQLSGMAHGDHAAAMCVTSPPFEDSIPQQDKQFCAPHDTTGYLKAEYGSTNGNIGNATGDTFWSASREILEALYDVLAPNAHACFVVKAFVRNKAIVDFPGQWAQLCEAVGFIHLHTHHALLTEDRGTQGNTDGEFVTKTVKRSSFFRRLHESKYPHLAIDAEQVLCFVKANK